ncbi:MAG: transcription-repair coupling factor [Dehalococcoidia bacterium]|nr:MAG: transcription-repair coupling factor [Dehalococcoidia bacterium]
MHLNGLLPLLRDTDEYRRLRTQLASTGSSTELTFLEPAIPYIVSSLQQDLAVPVCLIVADPERAEALRDELGHWVQPGTEVARLPEPDFPYAGPEGAANEPMIARAQLAAGLAIRTPRKAGLIVIASVLATIGGMRSPSDVAAAAIDLRRRTIMRPMDLLAELERMGYERVTFVTQRGQMSGRGGIIDVFSPTHDEPVRIEFFGDEIESLRFFDPVTQLSTTATERVLLSTTASGGESACILDYLPEETVVVLDDPEGLRLRSLRLHGELAEYCASDESSAETGTRSSGTYLDWSDIEARLGSLRRLCLLPWDDRNGSEGQPLFLPAVSYAQRIPTLLQAIPDMLARGERIVLASLQAQRLQELLEEAQQHVPITAELNSPPPPGSLTLIEGSVTRGWKLRDGLALFTDLEIFGFVKKARRPTKVHARPASYSLPFSTGDLVAHVDHGIGKFFGLTTLSTGGIEHEYLAIAYLGEDVLYVPTDQIRRVTRYIGGGEHGPALSRLGSTEWESAKQRARQSTHTLARELIELYARRQLTAGHSFSRDTAWQQEMEASFPYVETPDQMDAIDAVKRDLESTRPMDRLICGDVGYGKTEVALRAAFKAVMDSKQVAILTPTTVLAQQHYATFSERLAPFPVRTEVLSRLSSPQQEADTLAGLASGAVDICIGTHRLLQKDIQFKDLGLLIVDEEQRFGVLQKESLRSLKNGLDTLTLSATPIPRTLHMSLTGLRDMCTMETPPEERLAVRTHVGPYDNTLVRQAILRELERNGQTFFIHNRIATIRAMLQILEELVPEARFAIAHGQMHEHELERTMNAFAAREIDVLLATTIVQLGLDMPNANTLIVNQSERLGLTQLYQLRGRVGRGKNQAYAYFFFQRNRELTPPANRRLRTIFEANELGAGLEIALRDLEIRGTGSLLGTRQSGHIAAIGFELYCQILAEEVQRLKGESPEGYTPFPEKAAPVLDLPVSAYIPEEYVGPQGTRIGLYKRLADAATVGQLAAMEAEMKDRFGPVPDSVKDLLYVARIRVLAAAAQVKSITRAGSDIVLVPTRMGSLATEANLGPAVRVGNEQVRINTARTGGKWRALLEMLLRKAEGGAPAPPSR